MQHTDACAEAAIILLDTPRSPKMLGIWNTHIGHQPAIRAPTGVLCFGFLSLRPSTRNIFAHKGPGAAAVDY